MSDRPTDPAELIAAAASIDVALDAVVATRLCVYLDAMLAENRAVNLTAVRDPGQALVLHGVDSIVIARAFDAPPRRLLDIGTGNGFPGIAAAALWPDAHVVLCDRTRKKLDAIQRALAASSGITAETLWLDAAQARGLRRDLVGSFDAITARAVAEPTAVGRLARPLLAARGRLAVWLTADQEPAEALGTDLRLARVVRYELPEPARRARCIAVWQRSE